MRQEATSAIRARAVMHVRDAAPSPRAQCSARTEGCAVRQRAGVRDESTRYVCEGGDVHVEGAADVDLGSNERNRVDDAHIVGELKQIDRLEQQATASSDGRAAEQSINRGSDSTCNGASLAHRRCVGYVRRQRELLLARREEERDVLLGLEVGHRLAVA